MRERLLNEFYKKVEMLACDMFNDRENTLYNYEFDHEGLYIIMDIFVDKKANAEYYIKDVKCEFLPNCVSYLKDYFQKMGNSFEIKDVVYYLPKSWKN